MAATSSSAKSMLAYYGPRAGLEGLKLDMPVTPEELEFFAEQEFVDIVPNFSLAQGNRLLLMAGNVGPFQPDIPTTVPLWLALMLLRRRKCRILPPQWMGTDNLQQVYDEEKAVATAFQELPFYYVEIAQALFRYNPVDTFGSEEQYSKVRHLVEAIRKVRYSKIEAGLRKVGGPITVKLNNLSAAECNMIRMLFKGTLDHFYELGKSNKAWLEASVSQAPLSMSMSGASGPTF